MQDTLITYETAKLAKEKGFNLETLHYYYKNELVEPYLENGSSTDVEFRVDLEDLYDYHNKPYLKERCSAPTQSLLQKWLREKHKLSVCVDFREVEGPKIDGINSVYYDVNIYYLMGGDAWKKIKIKECSDDYEEALEVGLQEALKLIKI